MKDEACCVLRATSLRACFVAEEFLDGAAKRVVAGLEEVEGKG